MPLSEEDLNLRKLTNNLGWRQGDLERAQDALANEEKQAQEVLNKTQALVASAQRHLNTCQEVYEQAKLDLENYMLKQKTLRQIKIEAEQEPDFNSRASDDTEETLHGQQSQKRRR